MWPKALTQLVELAPHITRLLPLADRYFKDKTTGDDNTRQVLETHRGALDAQRAAVTDLGDRLHADIGAITSAQATQATTLQRQLSDLEKHLTTTRADALAAKQATETMEGRLMRIEAGQKSVRGLAIGAVILLVAILVLIVTMFLRVR